MDKYLNNTEKDDREKNLAISKVLNQKVNCNPKLDREYRDYCEYVGFIANEKGCFGVEKKVLVIRIINTQVYRAKKTFSLQEKEIDHFQFSEFMTN